MRRFAQDTSVAIARSREQIDKLLREWKCEGVAWMDHWCEDSVELQFKLLRLGPDGKNPVVYVARFRMHLEPETEIRNRCRGTRGFQDAKFREAMERRGRREHRLLFLWLKAALEVVEEGIITPEALFMPFFVCKDGRTVYEASVENMPKLISQPAHRLLPEITRGDA
jgi:hypothetical protein